MNAELWPCSTCGGPGVQNLGTRGHCTTHLTELLRSLDPSAWRMRGRWLQTGCLRPDHGPGFAECECPACGATAVAVVGSLCAYCETAVNRLNRWRAETILRPDLPDRDDPRHVDALKAWAERLAVAVRAEIVSEQDAHRAWDRTVRDVAA